MTLTVEAAIAVARSVAGELGLSCAPVVLADRSNLVLRLDPAGPEAARLPARTDPHPLVARVAMATSAVRVGVAWLRREVEVARFLDARGAHVTRPSRAIEAGPFERDGLVVSFWELEDTRGSVDATVAGLRLASAHRALRALPREHVPEWGGWREAREVLERAMTSTLVTEAERTTLRAAWDRGERVVEASARRTASFQPVHGDAHLGNVIPSARGPLWTDWEDAFVGPVEWDLACLRSRLALFGEDREAIEAATAAYHGEHDRGLVDELALVRNLQVIPWLAVFAERDPSLLPRMRARIAKL